MRVNNRLNDQTDEQMQLAGFRADQGTKSIRVLEVSQKQKVYDGNFNGNKNCIISC